MRRAGVGAIVFACVCVGCASLEVNTQVFDREGFKAAGGKLAPTPTEERLTPQEYATAIYDQAGAFGEALEAQAKEQFARRWRALSGAKCAAAFSMEPEEFATEYADIVRKQVIEPNVERVAKIRAQAIALGASTAPGDPNARAPRALPAGAARVRLVQLAQDITSLKEDVERKLKALGDKESKARKTDCRDFLRNEAKDPNKLRKIFPNLAAPNAAAADQTRVEQEIDQAVDQELVNVAPFYQELNVKFFQPIRFLDETAEEAASVKGDPNIGTLVHADEKFWGDRPFNKVYTHAWVGNSATTVRMQTLGEFHLKSVLFDPSQITKTTLESITRTFNMLADVHGRSPVQIKAFIESVETDERVRRESKMRLLRIAIDAWQKAEKGGLPPEVLTKLRQDIAHLAQEIRSAQAE